MNKTSVITLICLIAASTLSAQDYKDYPPARANAEWKEILPFNSDNWTVVNVNDHGIMPGDKSGVASDLMNLIENNDPNTIYHFPEGDYYFEAPLHFEDHDNDDRITDRFILRGAGPEKTRFLFDCDVPYFKGLIWVEDGHGYYSRDNMIVSCTTVPKAGDNVLYLDENDNNFDDIQPGTIICVKQDNDPELVFPEGSSDEAWYKKWQNGEADWSEESMGQFCKVVSVNGNQVTIAEPLGIDFKQQFNPRVSVQDMVAQQIGIQDLYIEHIIEDSEHTPGGTNDVFDIVFRFAEDCFVDNVHSYNTARGHVIIEYAYNISIMNSVFSQARNYGTGGAAYGVAVQNRSSNIYIANNEFDHLRHSIMLKEGANHCVIGYNWSHDWAIIDPNVPIEAEADMSIHGFYSHNNLFEGNLCNNIFYADYWGPTGPTTVTYRNRFYGEDTLDGAYVDDHSHRESIVANIIPALAKLYVADNCNDVYVEGNVVNGTAEWNTLSPSAELPPSLYLWGGKPGFWIDELVYPPYGPDEPNSATNLIPAAYKPVPTGINKNESPDFKFYPNPVENYITIESSGELSAELKIYDISGALMGSFRISGNNRTVDLNFLSSGVYVGTVAGKHFKIVKP